MRMSGKLLTYVVVSADYSRFRATGYAIATERLAQLL